MDIKNVHCSKCGAKFGNKWRGNIADKFVYYKNGDLKYIDLLKINTEKRDLKNLLILLIRYLHLKNI